MEQVTNKLRRRVNVSRSVKGVYTFDCTVEGDESYSADEILQMSDELIAALNKRYPQEEAS